MQSLKDRISQLAPLKIIIPGRFFDCQIYRGRLYLWTIDGSIIVYDWNKLLNCVVLPKYNAKLPFVFGFMEGNFLYDKKVACVFREDDYSSVLMRQYQSLIGKEIIIEPNDLFSCRIQELEMPLSELPTDTEVYANNIYFALDSGIYRRVLYSSPSEPAIGPKDTQLWDCRILSLRANKYPQIALSAGSDGLYELNLVKDAVTRPQAIENIDNTKIYRISDRPSSFSNYSFLSVFSSSYVDDSFLALFNWKPLDDLQLSQQEGRRVKVYRDFDEVIDESIIFGDSDDSDICWGIDDKIYRIKGNVLNVLKFNNAANIRKGEDYYRSLKSVSLPSNIGRPISAGVTYFGIVLEFTKGILVLMSDGNVTIIPNEVIRWRVYPRSKNYLNQLHLLYDDRLEVYSFNHDCLVNQSTKRIGLEYVPDDEHVYKNRYMEDMIPKMHLTSEGSSQSGDLNDFDLNEIDLPF